MRTTNLLKNTVSRLLIVSVLCLAVQVAAFAQVAGPMQEVEGKVYYMHSVVKGETLYSLSRFYKIDINEITAANKEAEAGLREGAVLRIPVDKSKFNEGTTVRADGKVFLSHEVQKKETLYSISQKYGIDINAIVAANPGADGGLRKGQVIRIPVASAQKEEELPNGWRWHTVQAGETAFSIGQKYGVSAEAILNANNGLNGGLKTDSRIKIPLPVAIAEAKPVVKPLIQGDSIRGHYKIAVCLPFFTDAPDSVILTERERKQREVAVNILRGSKMAIAQLEKEGLKADVYYHNVGDEKSHVTSLVKTKAFSDVDVIVGPTFRDPLFEMTAWSTKNDAHLVCPVPQTNKVLLSGSNISKTASSAATQWEKLGEILGKKYKNANVVLIQSGALDEVRPVQVFFDAFQKAAGDSCRLYRVTGKTLTGLATYISTTRQNVIVAPVGDKSLVASLFKVVTQPGTVFYGPDEWETMETITPELRNRFQVNFIKTTWVNYDEPKVQDWVEAFRLKYKSEPSEYAFIGYDLMLYYGRGLLKYGKMFPEHFDQIPQSDLLANQYNFFKTGPESGYENGHLYILTHQDYKVVQAP